MASITKQSNGRKTVQVKCPDGKRRSLRLGKVSSKVAGEVKTNVERIVAAKTTGQALDLHTARWLADISDELHERVVKIGLAEPRESTARRTVEQVVTEFGENRKDVKASTRAAWHQGHSSFTAFVGADLFIDEVTIANADDWWQSMIADGLKQATIRKRVRTVKTLINWAIRRGYLIKSPVSHLASTSIDGAAKPYVTRDVALKVIDKLPDYRWRLLFALGRFAGLRLPSEAFALRWSHVDWENDRIRVQVPKLEHIPGKGERVIPIFADLRDYLLTAFEQAEPGDDRVIALPTTTDAWRRKVVATAIKAAGVEPWSHVFHALRASCETDLMRSFPSHIVCKWIGHGLAVAERNYLQTTDDDFAKASGQKAVQNPVQYSDVEPRIDPCPDEENGGSFDDTPFVAKNEGENGRYRARILCEIVGKTAYFGNRRQQIRQQIRIERRFEPARDARRSGVGGGDRGVAGPAAGDPGGCGGNDPNECEGGRRCRQQTEVTGATLRAASPRATPAGRATPLPVVSPVCGLRCWMRYRKRTWAKSSQD